VAAAEELQSAAPQARDGHVCATRGSVSTSPDMRVMLLGLGAFLAGFTARHLRRSRRARTRARMEALPPITGSTSRGASERRSTRQAPYRVEAAVGLFAGAEVLLDQGYVLAAQIVDAILVVLLVNAGRRDERLGSVDTFDPSAAAMRALALVALVRVVGIGLPLREISDRAADILLAIVIGAAAVRLAPAVGVSLRALLRMRSVLIQVSTAAGGVALGVGAYLVGAPALSSPGDAAGAILLAGAAATLTAVVEEIIYRGLLQISFHRLWRGAGAVAATGVYASTYISIGSVSLLLVMALAGLLFAASVMRTGVLGGAVAGHVLLAVGAVVACPLLFGPTPSYVPPEPLTGLALGAAVLVGAVILGRR
jgi:membrane protease YdiL (CAAX protease family)